MLAHRSHHKVVLIGDSMAGKSSILHRLTKGVFLRDYRSTVGTGCGSWKSNNVNLQIWDTAGQEQYRSLGKIFYQGAEAAVVVYDRTDVDSAKHVKYWITQLTDVTGHSPFIAIAANKSDIATTEEQEVDIMEWARTNGYAFIETSAKTGDGVKTLFQEVASEIQRRYNMSPAIFAGLAESKHIQTAKGVVACC